MNEKDLKTILEQVSSEEATKPKRKVSKPKVSNTSKTKVSKAKVEAQTNKTNEDVKENDNMVAQETIQTEEAVNTQETTQEVVETPTQEATVIEEPTATQEVEEVEESTQEEAVEEASEILSLQSFKALSEDKQRELLLDWRAKYTTQRIKAEMGVATNVFYRLARRLGIPLATPTTNNTEAKEQRNTTRKTSTQKSVGSTANVSLTFEDCLLGSEMQERIQALMLFVDKNSEYEFKIEVTKK